MCMMSYSWVSSWIEPKKERRENMLFLQLRHPYSSALQHQRALLLTFWDSHPDLHQWDPNSQAFELGLDFTILLPHLQLQMAAFRTPQPPLPCKPVPTVNFFSCLSVRLSVSVCPSVCLSVYLSVCLAIHPSYWFCCSGEPWLIHLSIFEVQEWRDYVRTVLLLHPDWEKIR